MYIIDFLGDVKVHQACKNTTDVHFNLNSILVTPISKVVSTVDT